MRGGGVSGMNGQVCGKMKVIEFGMNACITAWTCIM
jgi:hypothetical protein